MDELIFGAVNVVPSGKGEDAGTPVAPLPTTGAASRNGQIADLVHVPTPINPDQFGAGVP